MIWRSMLSTVEVLREPQSDAKKVGSDAILRYLAFQQSFRRDLEGSDRA